MTDKFIKRWSVMIVQYRWLTILCFFLLLAGAIPFFKNLYFNSASDQFFVEGDPTLVQFDDFRSKFGSTEYLGFAIEAREGEKNVFTPEMLETIAQITSFFEDHEFVTKVTSLTNYQYTRSDGDSIATEDLIEDIEELDTSQASMDRLAEIMQKETMVHGALITADLKHTNIVVRTLYKKKSGDHKIKLINDMNEFVASINLTERGFKYHVFGTALTSERFATLSKTDTSRIYPIVMLLIVVALGFSFRKISGLLMPWLVIFGSVILVIGLMGLVGWPFNTINTSLPLIIVILGIGDSIHILIEFYGFREKGIHAKESAVKTMEVLFRPCFFTSFTTSMGFLALSVTHLLPIKQYGYLGAIGSFMAFLLSLTVLPAFLSFTNFSFRRKSKKDKREWIYSLMSVITPFVSNHQKMIRTGCTTALILFVVVSTQIKIDTNYVNYFDENMKVAHDLSYYDRVFGGVQNLEISIDSGEEGGVKNPEFLNKVDRLEKYISQLPQTNFQARSMLQYLKRLNQSMHGDDPAYFTLPQSRELLAQYLLLYESGDPLEDLSDLKSNDERFLRISISVKNSTSKEMFFLVNQIKEELTRNYPSLEIVMTGGLFINMAQMLHLLDGLTMSFSIAFLVILLCFIIVFRSVKVGLIGMIPSVFPIMLAGSIMYFLDIPLDMATMIVAAMTMGITVDASIHIINRYTVEKKKNTPTFEAIDLALKESGRAVFFTTVILVGGFSMMMMASFIPMRYMGMFSTIILSTSLLAGLVYLPSMLIMHRKQKMLPTTQGSQEAALKGQAG